MDATRTRHGGGFANENKGPIHFHRMRFSKDSTEGMNEVSIVPG